MKRPVIFVLLIFISSSLAQCNLTSRQKHLNDLAASPEWQPDKVIDSLKIQKGWFIGDLGAGGGYYTFRFAKETGNTGKVFAADINPEYLTGIEKKAKVDGVTNVESVLSDYDDSHFKDLSLDLIFIRNTFHHLDNKNQYMKKLSGKLKKGGRIVIIDYKNDAFLFWGHSVTKDDILSAIENTDLTIEKEFDFLEKQYFYIFKLKD